MLGKCTPLMDRRIAHDLHQPAAKAGALLQPGQFLPRPQKALLNRIARPMRIMKLRKGHRRRRGAQTAQSHKRVGIALRARATRSITSCSKSFLRTGLQL